MTLADLDRRIGLPAGACSAAIHKPYHRAEEAIADFLGVAARTLWPERYNSDGSRRCPQPKANYRPKRRFVARGTR